MITKAQVRRLQQRINQLEKQQRDEKQRRRAVGRKREKLIRYLIRKEVDRSECVVLRICLQDTLTRSSGKFPLSVRLPEDVCNAYDIPSGRVIVDKVGNVFRRNPNGSRGEQMTKIFVGFME